PAAGAARASMVRETGKSADTPALCVVRGSERPMHTTPTLEGLLDEAGWLRTLAASLASDAAQAEDLVQDTWLAALRREPRPGEARPWLGRVVRNLARNR